MISAEVREEAAELLNACQADWEVGHPRLTLLDAEDWGWSKEAFKAAWEAWKAIWKAITYTAFNSGYCEAENLIRLGWSPGEDIESY